MVSQPTKAVLMIFPISPQIEARKKEEDQKMRTEGLSQHLDETIIFIEQKV